MTTNDEDQPINLADVKSDDALIDAAGQGDPDAMRVLIDLFRAVNDNK